jgi:hypothetical protein
MGQGQKRTSDEKKKIRKPEHKERNKRHAGGSAELSGLAGLQQRVGNQAVQRLLVQRSGQSSFELDEETAGRINRERSGGQPLDEAAQVGMGASLGHDFSGVRVHISPEADALSHQLGAKAFTTGQDIFFREGAYSPHSSSGQELIGHELTHVVQQGTGAVKGHGALTVNAPGDAYEQQADAAAKTVVGGGMGAEAQRQAAEEEEVQMQAAEEEEVQMQAAEEEEVQMQAAEEEEVQMQAAEEEEVQMQAVEEEKELA